MTPRLFRAQFRYMKLFVLVLGHLHTASAAEPVLVELKLPLHFDPFALDAKAQYKQAAREACLAPKAKNFTGYRWRLPAVAAELRLMTGASEGKQVYIGFLKTKYGYNIATLNQDYGTSAQSFTELTESPIRVDATRLAIRKQDAEFDAPIRADMLDAILKALRECDPQHADGGIRLLLQTAISGAPGTAAGN